MAEKRQTIPAQLDLFVTFLTDLPLRDQADTMSVPCFALGKAMRKHAGKQEAGWSFTLRILHEKSGSAQRFSDFCRDVREIAAANQLPEYHLELYDGARGDQCLHAVRRTLLAPDHPDYDPSLLNRIGKQRTWAALSP